MNARLKAAEERFNAAFQSCIARTENLRVAQKSITRLLEQKDPFGSDHKAQAIQEVLDEDEKIEYDECRDEAGAKVVSDAFKKIQEGLASA